MSITIYQGERHEYETSSIVLVTTKMLELHWRCIANGNEAPSQENDVSNDTEHYNSYTN